MNTTAATLTLGFATQVTSLILQPNLTNRRERISFSTNIESCRRFVSEIRWGVRRKPVSNKLHTLTISPLEKRGTSSRIVSVFKPISYDLVKPLRAFRFSPIFVRGTAIGCCFFILEAGIGLYGGMGLFSKYRINCCTFLPGFGIGVLLTEIGCASSLTRTKFSSSLSVSPDNNLLISSLRLVFILLLYIILLLFERTICILVCGAISLSLDKPPKTGSNRIPKVKSKIYNMRRCRHVLYYYLNQTINL